MPFQRTGIVLCHEVWGITPALRAAASDFERAGHDVAVADFYGGAVVHTYRSASTLRDALTLDGIHAGLQGAIDVVQEAGATRVVVIGYSMGGAIALWAATTLPVDLAVTYYGGGIAKPYWSGMPSGPDLAARLSVPWLGFYGGRDPLTPRAQLETLSAAASQAPNPGEVIVYEQADHGFALDPADPRHD